MIGEKILTRWRRRRCPLTILTNGDQLNVDGSYNTHLLDRPEERVPADATGDRRIGEGASPGLGADAGRVLHHRDDHTERGLT